MRTTQHQSLCYPCSKCITRSYISGNIRVTVNWGYSLNGLYLQKCQGHDSQGKTGTRRLETCINPGVFSWSRADAIGQLMETEWGSMSSGMQCWLYLQTFYRLKIVPNDSWTNGWKNIKRSYGDFSDGTMDQNSPANAEDKGLISGLGRSHMLQSNKAHML